MGAARSKDDQRLKVRVVSQETATDFSLKNDLLVTLCVYVIGPRSGPATAVPEERQTTQARRCSLGIGAHWSKTARTSTDTWRSNDNRALLSIITKYRSRSAAGHRGGTLRRGGCHVAQVIVSERIESLMAHGHQPRRELLVELAPELAVGAVQRASDSDDPSAAVSEWLRSGFVTHLHEQWH